MEKDILQNINFGDLKCLRDIFKKDWPYAAQAYMFVDNWIKWINKDPNAGVEFMAPDGDWTDGTFVVIVTECTYNLYFFTLQKSCERLALALKETKRIDWKRGPYICAIHEDIDKACMKILKNIGHPIDFEIVSSCHWLPKEVALNLNTSYPDEFYIAPLQPSHSDTINPLWLYKFPKSEIYLANLIKMNGGIGLFQRTTNILCSWAITNDYGALGVLQTVKEHQRKKLGSELIKELAKRRANVGLDSISNVASGNLASEHLFNTLGFIKTNNVRWVQFKRNKIKSLL